MTQTSLNIAVRDAYLAEYPFVCPPCPPCPPCPECPPATPQVWESPTALVTTGNYYRAADHGVISDGVTNMATQLQAAMNAADAANQVLFTRGQIKVNSQLTIPAGLKWNGYDTRLISGKTAIVAEPGAPFLVCNTAGVNDIAIGGLELFGPQATGGNDEHQHGIAIYKGIGFQFFDMMSSRFNGDGFYFGTLNTTDHLANITLTNNRSFDNVRNNGSLIDCDGFNARGCTWDKVRNVLPAGPSAGFDVEPNNSSNIVKNVFFEDCTFNDNGSGGLLVIMKPGATQQLTVTARRCEMKRNGSDGSYYGFTNQAGFGFTLEDCVSADNANRGMHTRGAVSNLRLIRFRTSGNVNQSVFVENGTLTGLYIEDALLDSTYNAFDGIMLNAGTTNVQLVNTRIDRIRAGKAKINLNGAAAGAVSGTPLP